MQVFSTVQTGIEPSKQREFLTRFASHQRQAPDAETGERFVVFLSPEEILLYRNELQFPDYAVQECTNSVVQSPKVEVLDDLTYGVLNLYSDNETGLNAEEITFFLSHTGIVIVSGQTDLTGRVIQAVSAEITARHMMGILPERTLFFLLEKIIASDAALIRGIDEDETILEEKLLAGEKLDYPTIIFRMRQKTLLVMQYAGLMVDLSAILEENDNCVIPDAALRMFHLIGSRLDRLERSSVTLRESVMQLREAYQSQVDIDANLMMRLFTVVSTIFLPLTVLTGWYGMNFRFMPELSWKYGYLLVFLAAVSVTIGIIWLCKRKKYL